MTKTFFRLISRARRRIAVSGALLLAAYAIAGNRLPLPLPFVGPDAALGVALGLAIALAALHLRPLRYLVEIAALATLLFALFGRALPGSVFDAARPAPDTLAAVLAWAGLAAVAGVGLYGRWADRLTPRRGPLRKARGVSRIDLDTLWYALVPTPGHAARYPAPGEIAIAAASPDHSRVWLRGHTPAGAPFEALLHIFESEPPFHVRLRVDPVAGDCGLDAGVIELSLVDLGDHRLVLVRQELAADWLDDGLGRRLDRRLAAVDRVQRTGRASAASSARRIGPDGGLGHVPEPLRKTGTRPARH